MSVASLLTATLAAFQPPHVALRSQPQPILSRVSTAAAMSMPPMLEPQMHAQMAAVGAAATLLADGDGGMLGAVFDTLRNIFTGVLLVGLVAIPLYYIYGVFILSPEEREEQGIGKLLTDLTYAYTPSPWRKTYLAGTEEEEARDPLDLPSWCSEEATLVTAASMRHTDGMDEADMPSDDEAPEDLECCCWLRCLPETWVPDTVLRNICCCFGFPSISFFPD